MTGLWIDACIWELDCSLTEKVLLALVCFRASNRNSEACTDEDKDLAAILKIHPVSVSRDLKKLHDAGLIVRQTERRNGLVRTLRPLNNLLRAYQQNAKRPLNNLLEAPADSPVALNNTLRSSKQIAKNLLTNCIEPLNKTLRPYIGIKQGENKEETIENISTAVAASDDAGEAAEQIDVDTVSLESEKQEKAPLTPATPPEPPPPKPGEPVGDGRLRKSCLTYNTSNPGKYTPDMYRAFLAYWTAKVQNSTKKSEIGKELWETQRTWDLAGRLSRWHQNNQTNDQQRNPANGRKSADFLNRQRIAEPAKNGYGKL